MSMTSTGPKKRRVICYSPKLPGKKSPASRSPKPGKHHQPHCFIKPWVVLPGIWPQPVALASYCPNRNPNTVNLRLLYLLYWVPGTPTTGLPRHRGVTGQTAGGSLGHRTIHNRAQIPSVSNAAGQGNALEASNGTSLQRKRRLQGVPCLLQSL